MYVSANQRKVFSFGQETSTWFPNVTHIISRPAQIRAMIAISAGTWSLKKPNVDWGKMRAGMPKIMRPRARVLIAVAEVDESGAGSSGLLLGLGGRRGSVDEIALGDE